jgi:hypothetical protein
MSRIYWELFPATSSIRDRTQIIYWEKGLLVGLTDHFYNTGDPLERLIEMYLDAKGLKLFNFSKRSGNLLEAFDCVVSKTDNLINVSRHIRGVLHFSACFIECDGKKYLIVKENDSAYIKFDKILNPLTPDDFNVALLQ